MTLQKMSIEHKKKLEELYQIMMEQTIAQIRENIKNYIPDTLIQDFFLWLLQRDNTCFDSYLSFLGMHKIVETSVALLANLLVKNQKPSKEIYHDLAILNSYFAFEVISDNLAIGLGLHNTKDVTFIRNKNILIKFNESMIEKLKNNKLQAFDVLGTYKNAFTEVPCYDHDLFINKYIESNPNVSKNAFSDLTFYYLVLNIESASLVLNLTHDHFIYPIIKKSLIARYRCLNKLFEVNELTKSSTLADYGTYTILVIPTIAFALSTAYKINPDIMMDKLSKNNILESALYNAACIVRLCNDVGTKLLSSREEFQNAFFKKLMKFNEENKDHHVFNNVLNLFKHIDVFNKKNDFHYLFRIQKDIKQDEFNICIDNIRNIKNVDIALKRFFNNIKFYSKLYKENKNSLLSQLKQINQQVGNEKISNIIMKMVEFHEVHYSHDEE